MLIPGELAGYNFFIIPLPAVIDEIDICRYSILMSLSLVGVSLIKDENHLQDQAKSYDFC